MKLADLQDTSFCRLVLRSGIQNDCCSFRSCATPLRDGDASDMDTIHKGTFLTSRLPRIRTTFGFLCLTHRASS